VSIDAVDHELSRLEAEVARLRERVLAAEYIATEETIENMGSLLETLARLQDIQREQWRFLVSDGAETLGALRRVRSVFDVPGVALGHCQRRARHVVGGMNRAMVVCTGGAQSLTRTFVEMWRPFLAMVGQDWKRT